MYNNMTCETDIYGNKIYRAFNPYGLMIYFKDEELGYEEWYDYNERGFPIYYKNTNGTEWWKMYDNKNRLIYKRENLGVEPYQEECWLYDKYDRLVSYKRSDGFYYDIFYDGNTEKYVDSEFNIRIKKYDDNGNVIYTKNEHDFETWRRYNENNQLIEYNDSDWNIREYQYDNNNNLVLSWDAYGEKRIKYDNGKISEVRDSDDYSFRYHYDENGTFIGKEHMDIIDHDQ